MLACYKHPRKNSRCIALTPRVKERSTAQMWKLKTNGVIQSHSKIARKQSHDLMLVIKNKPHNSPHARAIRTKRFVDVRRVVRTRDWGGLAVFTNFLIL